MRPLKLLLIIFCLFSTFGGWANNSKRTEAPTVGLVLSGGGAKGFAHIGVIQLLEEAGIKPDYVTGTSMGAIVGGLYAMGYTVDEMRQIADTTDWTMVLSNTVPLSDVTYIEKPYYSTFITELNITNTGIKLPEGLIEGQNLMAKLSALTTPVHGIYDFTKFPIPFTCVATDIERGVPVSLSKGNIANALRASMAIPTAFTPVVKDSMLLIDGGWTRNLPVQEAKAMGADIIISVDVGSALKSKEELTNLMSILDQTAWILSAQDTEKQLKMSDYVVRPSVSTYSTFDFPKSLEIIDLGYETAKKQKAVFQELAKRINAGGEPDKRKFSSRADSLYTIGKVRVEGNRLTSSKYIQSRMDIKPFGRYSLTEITDKVTMLYGSLYYKKVNFELIRMSDTASELIIRVLEDNPAKLKLAFYYDSENSVGVNLNLTTRNLGIKNSRFVLDAFISENPMVFGQFFKYVNKKQSTFLYLDGRYTRNSRFLTTNLAGNDAVYNYREATSNLGFAYTDKNNLILGTNIGLGHANVRPKVNSDSLVDRWNENTTRLQAFLYLNSLNSAIFPKHGTRFLIDLGYDFHVNHHATLSPKFSPEQEQMFNEWLKVRPHVTFQFTYDKYYAINKKLTAYGGVRMSMLSETVIGFNDYTKVGGISPILSSAIPFWGVTRNSVNVMQYGIASAGGQYEVVPNFFVRAKVNYLNANYPMNWIDPNRSEQVFTIAGHTVSDIWGAGLETAYKTPFGPIRVVAHANEYERGVNFFVAIGYNIYKTHGEF